MNYREKRFVAALLDMAGDEFSNHGCNDLQKDIVGLLDSHDKDALQLAYHVWNGDPEDYSPGRFFEQDWIWMNYFADVLRQEADQEEKGEVK